MEKWRYGEERPRESLEYKQDVTEWSRGNILERDLNQSSYLKLLFLVYYLYC